MTITIFKRHVFMDMNNKEPGLGDDIKCSKCNSGFLDTGLECTECGHDMRPEIYPEDYRKDSFQAPESIQ
jgi:hypothetical protein